MSLNQLSAMLGVLVEEKDVILLFKNKKLQEAYFFLKRILNGILGVQ